MAIRSGSRIGERVASQATADADDDAMNGIDVYALWRTRAERVIASFASAAPRHPGPDANAALRLGRCGVTARVEAAFKSSGTACGALDLTPLVQPPNTVLSPTHSGRGSLTIGGVAA